MRCKLVTDALKSAMSYKLPSWLCEVSETQYALSVSANTTCWPLNYDVHFAIYGRAESFGSTRFCRQQCMRWRHGCAEVLLSALAVQC